MKQEELKLYDIFNTEEDNTYFYSILSFAGCVLKVLNKLKNLRLLMFITLVLSFIPIGYSIDTFPFGTTQTNFDYVGYSTSFRGLAQEIDVGLTGCYNLSINTQYLKVGSPTDNLNISLQTDNAGEPSGTLVETDSYFTTAASGFSSVSYTAYNFSLPSCVNLTAGDTYWIVYKRTGSYSSSNYLRVATHDSSPNANSTTLYKRDTGTWDSVGTNRQTVSTIYLDSPIAGVSVSIKNVTANNNLFLNNTNFTVDDITFNVTYEVNNTPSGNFTNSSITTLNDLANGKYYIQFEVCYGAVCDTSINYTYRVNVSSALSTDIQTYYNTSNIQINLTSTENKDNIYYSLDGAAEVLICSNCNQSIINLTSLNDSLHTIDFRGVLSGVNDTLNQSFTIDTTKPTISHNIPSEINTYNWTGISINATDTNIDTCLFEIESTNYSCSTFTAYNFTTNGYKNWTIYASDLAGNSATETGQLLVNPYQYFYLNDSLGNRLYNFTFEGELYEYFAQVKTYNDHLSVGNNSYTFRKAGYEDLEVYININTTSNINTTFITNRTTLYIIAIDEITNNQISLFNATISNGTHIISFTNVNNISISYINETLPKGEIELFISSAGYEGRKYQTTLDPYSMVNIKAYLLPITDGEFVSFFVYDNENAIVEDAIIIIYQIINDTNEVITQVRTDAAGYTSAYLNTLNQQQHFIVIKDGYIQKEFSIRSGATEYTIFLSPIADLWEKWDSNINYRITPTSTILYNNEFNFTYEILDAASALTQWGFSIYNSSGLIYTTSSTNNVGGSLNYYNDNISGDIRVELYYISGSNSKEFKKYYTIRDDSWNIPDIQINNIIMSFFEDESLSHEAKVLIWMAATLALAVFVKRFSVTQDTAVHAIAIMSLLGSYGGLYHFGLTAISIVGTYMIIFNKVEDRS